MADTVADILERAAGLLSEPGAWTQMDWGNRESCFCVLGAIAHVAGEDPDAPWGDTQASAAREPLAEAIGIATYEVVDWNDAPDRTQDEVVAKLKEAAALARERGQ